MNSNEIYLTFSSIVNKKTTRLTVKVTQKSQSQENKTQYECLTTVKRK